MFEYENQKFRAERFKIFPDRFVRRHPYLSFEIMFLIVPAAVLSLVTAAAELFAWIFNWIH